jgi:hypothetical protein
MVGAWELLCEWESARWRWRYGVAVRSMCRKSRARSRVFSAPWTFCRASKKGEHRTDTVGTSALLCSKTQRHEARDTILRLDRGALSDRADHGDLLDFAEEVELVGIEARASPGHPSAPAFVVVPIARSLLTGRIGIAA